MAVIWITHDLALVAGIVDRVAVMYAGSIVENGTVDAIFSAAQHPYTQGLLQSMPNFDAVVRRRLNSIKGSPPDLRQLVDGCPFAPRCSVVRRRLNSIKGSPPDLRQLVEGCPFAPRCSLVVDQCRAERPALESAGARSRVACWQADMA
jgi:oligopeptide/dipeptide ABC transporter ATP-binding protein